MEKNEGRMEDVGRDDTADMLTVLCGPTAEYAGSVSALPPARRANVVRICKIALKRLGDDITLPGEVPPRVIGCLLNEGSYCRDPAATAYWGGILACSRSANRLDDRAARRLKMLGRMGEYQIRSHYLFYATLRLLLMRHREAAKVDFEGDRLKLSTFIPAGYYILAMNYSGDEIDRMPRLVSDVLYGLGQEFLLDGSNTGSDDYLKSRFTTNVADVIRGEGIVFAPALAGIQLFLWAFGVRDADARYFLDPRLDCGIPDIPMGVEESGLVYKPDP